MVRERSESELGGKWRGRSILSRGSSSGRKCLGISGMHFYGLMSFLSIIERILSLSTSRLLSFYVMPVTFVLKLYAVMCTFYWQFFTDNCWVRFRFLWAGASCWRWGLLLLFFRFLWHFWLMRVCFSMPVQLIVLLFWAVMYLTQTVDHLAFMLPLNFALHFDISLSPIPS